MNAVNLSQGNAAAGAESSRRAHWPVHIGFVITSAAFAALYAGTFGSLIDNWAHDGTFQYAFLIFPIVAFLVWDRRSVLRRLAPAPEALGGVILGGLCSIWLAGALADINLVRQVAVLAMIPGLVFTFYGRGILWALVFPMAYLYFALPIGGSLVVPLQHITANLSVAFLHLTRIPVYLSSHYITTPLTTWDVAKACSGIKFFIATTAVGILYANLFFRGWKRRLLFVAAAMVVPVIANGLRVYFTILIGEQFGLQYASGTDHLIFGWQFFGLVLVLLFLAGWPWHETGTGGVPPARPEGAESGLPGASRAAVLSAIMLAVLTAAPALMWLTAPSAAVAGQRVKLDLPPSLAGLSQSQKADPAPGPGTVFHHANGQASARYGGAGHGVHVYVAMYTGAPQEGHELTTFGNRVYDRSIWGLEGSEKRALSPLIPPLRELRLQRKHGSRRWLIWYWYRVADHTTTSALTLKALQAWGRLGGAPQRAWVVTLATPLEQGSPESARQRLRRAAAPLARWVDQSMRVAP